MFERQTSSSAPTSATRSLQDRLRWTLAGLGLALLVLLVLPSAQIKLGASQLNGLVGSYTSSTPHYDVTITGGTIVSTPPAVFRAGDSNNYYGAGTASSSGAGKTCTASAKGPLTATFNWNNGGDATALPPPSVIISQTCTAGWGNNPTSSATGTGTANNGLSTGVLTTSANGASSTSTLYTGKDTPGATFSVTCNPTATFTGTDGSAYDAFISGNVNVTYQASVALVDVPVGGMNSGRQLLTGSAASCSLSVPLPFSVDKTTYKWSATGDVFYTYNEHAPSHQLILLSDDPSYTTGPSFGFFDKSADTITVTCKATVVCPDGTRLPISVTAPAITSVKPTGSWSTSNGQAGYGHFFTGTSMGTNDLWNPITVTVPQHFSGGKCCLAQLITPVLRLTRNIPNGGPANFYYKTPQQNPDGTTSMVLPGQGLDTAFPYPVGISISGTNVTPVTPTGGYIWNVPDSGTSGDSPTFSLSTNPQDSGGSDWSSAYGNENFTTYLMYQPPGGVWVPIQRLDWGWQGTANRTNGKWTANVTDFAPSTGSDTSTPPQWNSVLVANDQLYP